MPRPKKYDWSDKKEVCHRLYVEEKRPTREVVKYFSEALGVPKEGLPPTNTFTRQFREWGFPSRRHITTSEEETKIAERIRELWQENHGNAVIVETLHAEGWDISESTIGSIRRRHGLVLRGGHKYDPGPRNSGEHATPEQSVTPATPGQDDSHDIAGALAAHNAGSSAPKSQSPTKGDMFTTAPDATYAQPIEATARSSKRLLDLQQESDELFSARKRRRRIRPRGQLPPDAPGLPPRYKSETSLDECKAYLQLNNDLYQAMRRHFMAICADASIVKKTLCEPGVWEASKDRLVREHAHVNAVMNAPHPEPDKVANALEVICVDVTKRLRVIGTRVSIQDANNGLNLNPTQSKQLRHQFYQILEADGFTTRLGCGDEHWDELFQRWLNGAETLRTWQAQQPNGVFDADTRRLLGVLARDAMKRYNDDRVRRDPSAKHFGDRDYGIGPGPARGNKRPEGKRPAVKIPSTAPSAHPAPLTPQPPSPQPQQEQPRHQHEPSLDLDPALFAPPPPLHPLVQIPAFFRLAPSSHLIGHHPKDWIAKLDTLSLAALHKAATSKAGAAKVGRVHGIVRNMGVKDRGAEEDGLHRNGEEGEDGVGEDAYLIESDRELEAYVEAAKANTEGKVVFSVELRGGYA